MAKGRLNIMTLSGHPGRTPAPERTGAGGPGAGSYRRRRYKILGPGALWHMGPGISVSQPALATVECGARGRRRRKDECPAYHGSSHCGPSWPARALAATASRAESLNLPVRIPPQPTAATRSQGNTQAEESQTSRLKSRPPDGVGKFAPRSII